MPPLLGDTQESSGEDEDGSVAELEIRFDFPCMSLSPSMQQKSFCPSSDSDGHDGPGISASGFGATQGVFKAVRLHETISMPFPSGHP